MKNTNTMSPQSKIFRHKAKETYIESIYEQWCKLIKEFSSRHIVFMNWNVWHNKMCKLNAFSISIPEGFLKCYKLFWGRGSRGQDQSVLQVYVVNWTTDLPASASWELDELRSPIYVVLGIKHRASHMLVIPVRYKCIQKWKVVLLIFT